jgi:cysteine desulfurase
VIDGALRVSLIYTSREEELRQLADALAEGIRTVAHR